jgi:uncharacterized radical SAM superfamily Fe-S cluster-containing enzyme
VVGGEPEAREIRVPELMFGTQSICPRCKRLLDADLVDRDGRIFLERTCPDHGSFAAVVYGDAARYSYRQIQRFNKPGSEPLQRQTAADAGCPHDCGICPEHAQHTCLGIIEVNTACNLDCPICFADSGTGVRGHGFSLSLSQVESMLDASFAPRGSRSPCSSQAGSLRSIRRSSRYSLPPSRVGSSGYVEHQRDSAGP